MAAGGEVCLSEPPPRPTSGEPLWVDFRVGASRLNQVNTAQETAYIKVHSLLGPSTTARGMLSLKLYS